MAEFAIVDLTTPDPPGATLSPSPTGASGQGLNSLGNVDTSSVAASLEELRADLSDHIQSSEHAGLHLSELVVRLTLSAEGRIAFVAKGTAEACIEVTFRTTP